MTYEEKRRMLKNWRGRRYLACTAADQLRNVIEWLGTEDGSELPPDGGVPPRPAVGVALEIENMITSVQRLILLLNDGNVSQSRLQSF